MWTTLTNRRTSRALKPSKDSLPRFRALDPTKLLRGIKRIAAAWESQKSEAASVLGIYRVAFHHLDRPMCTSSINSLLLVVRNGTRTLTGEITLHENAPCHMVPVRSCESRALPRTRNALAALYCPSGQMPRILFTTLNSSLAILRLLFALVINWLPWDETIVKTDQRKASVCEASDSCSMTSKTHHLHIKLRATKDQHTVNAPSSSSTQAARWYNV